MEEHFFYVKIYFTRRKALMELRRMNARTRSSVEQAVLEEARLTYGRENVWMVEAVEVPATSAEVLEYKRKWC